MKPVLAPLMLSCLAIAAIPGTAAAALDVSVVACRANVVEQASAYAADALKAVQDCANGRATGSLPPATDCSTPDAAAAATGTPLGTTALENDPGTSDCAAVTPASALYTSCPAPCDAIATADWAAVGDCMKCAIDAEVASYLSDTAGNAPAPATMADRNCVLALTSSSSRVTRIVLRANDRCQRRGDAVPQHCERLDAKSRTKLRKTVNKGAQNIARKCAEANLPGIGGCATSLADTGCVQNAAQRHATSLVTIVSRLVEAAPASASAQFTTVEVLSNAIACAIGTDGTAACWGGSYEYGGLTAPGRFADLSSGCWLRDDGTPDCRGLEASWYDPPPPGPFTAVDANGYSGNERPCGLAADGSIVCWWGDETTYTGPYTKFSRGYSDVCGIRPDATLHCWPQGAEDDPTAYDRPGSFVDVSAADLSCAVRTDGSLDCWGTDNTEITDPALLPPTGTFTRVATSAYRACAVREDGTLACWGYPDGSTPPSGTFVDVSVSNEQACALASDGSLSCWGANYYGSSSGPPYRPGAAALSSNGRCTLGIDGSIECWGTYPDGAAAAPAGSFDQVAAGHDVACAIAADASLRCWGKERELAGPFLQVAVSGHSYSDDGCALRSDGTVDCWGTIDPAGTFVYVDDGDNGAYCGLRTDGTVHCWSSYSTTATPLPGAFTQLASGDSHLCGLRASGLVECYLYYCGPYGCNEGQASPPADSFTQISAGGDVTCGIRTDGTIRCWGEDNHGMTSPPAGTFTQLSVGRDHSCAVRSDATVACWGYDRFGDTEPPAGTFTAVAAGNDFTCGRRTDATLECWGSSDHGVAAPPAGPWIDLDSSSSTGCGIQADGTLSCWGREDGNIGSGVGLPPAGTFMDVSTDLGVACGVRTDGTVACWGNPMPSPPPGTFVEVVTGTAHACGRRTDGTVSCWGDDSMGQASPPFATYAQISAAGNHSCGVHTDGTLACWGERYEETVPRGGSFTEVAAGSDVACARRTDGSIACWGSDGVGQATPPTELFEHVYAGDAYACALRADSTSACWGAIVRP